MVINRFAKIISLSLILLIIAVGIGFIARMLPSNIAFVENSQQSPTRDIGLLDPVEFNLPATAKEIPEKRTETSATFEISPGKFAAVSSGKQLFARAYDGSFIIARNPSEEEFLCNKKPTVACFTSAFLARLIPSVFATTAGPNSPSTVENVTNQANWTHCSPFHTWTNPSNAAGSDNTYATFIVTTSFRTTACLKATSFGFSIPSTATIDGVEVAIERKSSQSSGTDNSQDESVYLVKAGVPSGNDKGAATTNWPTTEASATYGGAADLWGTTLTPTNINATDFGATLNATITASGA